MSSLTFRPQNSSLVDAVDELFAANGWMVEAVSSETQDLIVTCGHFRYSIICLDKTISLYKSGTSIIEAIETNSQFLRKNANRTIVTILDTNFLNVNLSNLLKRRFLVVTLDEIEEVTSLSRYAATVPPDLSPRQDFLVRGDIGYAIFVSDKLRSIGSRNAALEWGRLAVELSSGFTGAYFHLFSLYRHYRLFSEADELAGRMAAYRANDPRVIKEIAAYKKERKDFKSADIWQRKLAESTSVPRTLGDILEKQRWNRRVHSEVRTHPVEAAEQFKTEEPQSLHNRILRLLKLIKPD